MRWHCWPATVLWHHSRVMPHPLIDKCETDNPSKDELCDIPRGIKPRALRTQHSRGRELLNWEICRTRGSIKRNLTIGSRSSIGTAHWSNRISVVVCFLAAAASGFSLTCCGRTLAERPPQEQSAVSASARLISKIQWAGDVNMTLVQCSFKHANESKDLLTPLFMTSTWLLLNA
jgi:hypothetical protein